MRWLEVLLLTLASQAAWADEPGYAQRAPIEVTRRAAFVLLPLPVGAYAQAQQPGLADLRVVDAAGERVPHALLAPRSGSQTAETARDAALYALPVRPIDETRFESPVQISVRGDVIQVRRDAASAGTAATRAASAGWLADLGDPPVSTTTTLSPVSRSLRLQWTGAAEFSAPFDWDSSDDLRRWRPGGTGQLMALASRGGALRQDLVPLDTGTGRFVRIYWRDAASAPSLSAAQLVITERRDVALDAPTPLVLTPTSANEPDAKGALQVDLGGVLPLVSLQLRWPAGNQVAPLRVQGRARADQAWQPLMQGVVYRLEHGASVSESLPLTLQGTARFLRIVPDERAAALDATQVRVIVQAQLASLVFAAQGKPPYALLAGSPAAAPGALPAATLVPGLDEERARFGSATLGAFSEVQETTLAAQAEAQRAAWRPRVLWAVLLLGVAGLGWMVWRMTRGAVGR